MRRNLCGEAINGWQEAPQPGFRFFISRISGQEGIFSTRMPHLAELLGNFQRHSDSRAEE